MPKYVIRMAGETAKPGWIANVNPFVVVCFVSFITRLMAKRSAITSIKQKKELRTLKRETYLMLFLIKLKEYR